MANAFEIFAQAMTLTDNEKVALVQALIQMGTQGAQVSAPIAQTAPQSTAPTQVAPKVRNTTPKECVDTEIHVTSLGKGYLAFTDADGKGVATRYMQCVKDAIASEGKMLVWDKSYERKEVYARDYTEPKTGVFHAKGSHKMGAYTLFTSKEVNGKLVADKALSAQTVGKWAKEHEVFHVSANDAKKADDDRIKRNTRKNERDARKLA